MGLDMFLHAKRYLGYNEDEIASKVAEQFPELKGKRVKEVIVEAMYWRKANAIHKWFVDNIQDGTDDCGYYYVSRRSIEALRDLILEALETKNSKLLPPQAGFFFGSTDLDEWYWDDLVDTANSLAKVLDDFDDRWDFEYHSSW